MKYQSFLASLFLILTTSALSFAQIEAPKSAPASSEPTKEKTEERIALEKKALKLVDRAVGEAALLKLWENRSLSFAMAGDLLWESNQKRAKALFRDAGDELARGAIEPNKKTGSVFEEFNFWKNRSPRRQILLMIASRDAEMALDLLVETRPPDLQKAIDRKNQPKVKGQNTNAGNFLTGQADTFKVQQELSLEQQFASKAAEEDPQKAAKLIRESLNKGITMQAINLIKKINKKDEELGKELLDEIIDKVLSTKFENVLTAELQIAQYLLKQKNSSGLNKLADKKVKPLKIEESDLKDIAEKVADFYINSNDFQSSFAISRVIDSLKKYAPSKIAQLKQKQNEANKITPKGLRQLQDSLDKLGDPNSTPEELLEAASNQPSYLKKQFYKSAIDKYIKKGETDKARDAISAEKDSPQKAEALDYLNSKVVDEAIDDDNFDEAEALVAQSETKKSRILLLVKLAVEFENKNTEESHNRAVKLIERATGLINEFPESRDEVSDILEVSAGLARIEPDRAFSYLNNLIYMGNDLLTAYALIAKYNKRNDIFRNGEMLFTHNFIGKISKHGKSLEKLAEADFEKTESLIDQFQRQDTQILAKFLLAQSILTGKISLTGSKNFSLNYSFQE